MDEISIKVNGLDEALPLKATVEEMLRIVESDPARKGIAIAINDSIVRRADWSGRVIANGDRVDIIQATQGG